MAYLLIEFAVCAAVVVERDIKRGKVAQVRFSHIGDQRLFRATFLPSPDHDRRAVRVVGADVNAAVAAQLLKTDPDIGLDVFNQVPQMNMSVGIGQSGCHQDASCRHACVLLSVWSIVDGRSNSDWIAFLGPMDHPNGLVKLLPSALPRVIREAYVSGRTKASVPHAG